MRIVYQSNINQALPSLIQSLYMFLFMWSDYDYLAQIINTQAYSKHLLFFALLFLLGIFIPALQFFKPYLIISEDYLRQNLVFIKKIRIQDITHIDYDNNTLRIYAKNKIISINTLRNLIITFSSDPLFQYASPLQVILHLRPELAAKKLANPRPNTPAYDKLGFGQFSTLSTTEKFSLKNTRTLFVVISFILVLLGLDIILKSQLNPFRPLTFTDATLFFSGTCIIATVIGFLGIREKPSKLLTICIFSFCFSLFAYSLLIQDATKKATSVVSYQQIINRDGEQRWHNNNGYPDITYYFEKQTSALKKPSTTKTININLYQSYFGLTVIKMADSKKTAALSEGE